MKSSVIANLKFHSSSNPQRVIVKDSQRHWTWSELISRATDYSLELSNFKLDQKVIPIVVDRTGETIAALIGCLLSGKGFAPLSGNQPKERLEKCLSALDTKVLITTSLSEQLPVFDNVENIFPSTRNEFIDLDAVVPIEAEEIIYNLFTSGSTGVPKGVLVSAANIENTMLWSKDFLNWEPCDVIGSATNFFFDISMFDFFTMLYFDVPIGIFSQTSNPDVVFNEIKIFNVTSIFSVPLFFSQLSRIGLQANGERLYSLRRVVAGGDFFPPAHVLTWMNECPNVAIFNVWGPTETSIVNTMHLVASNDIPLLKEGKSPSVGRAHELMPFVLVDETRQNIVDKPFERGEVVMLGPCVTKGYLKAPELSSMSYGQINGQPAFYTQDLGYLDHSGELFILGRMGSTVKISGYRVDLGEIESVATKYENVYIAAAFVRKISDEVEELWIVVELKNIALSLDVFDFKTFLRNKLPHYMVPKRIFTQEVLPKNSNGKIDRNQIKKADFK